MRNTILVADGNEVNREILVELFEEKYTVIEAETGDKALEMILSSFQDLAALVLDLNLVGKSAIEILTVINKQSWFETLPVVVLAEDTSLKIEKLVLKAGATHLNRKPFDSSLLKEKVEKYVELYGVREELLETKEALKRATLNSSSSNDNGALIDTAGLNHFLSMHNNMIELIGTLVEYRNPENRNHVQRMRGLVKILGKTYMQKYPESGLTDAVIDDIVTACSIHDIGKMAVPDTILLKPGRLTDEEYEEMKSHPLCGIALLDTVNGVWDESFDKVVRQVVRSHHEKFDGGGYPDGLKGDAIPIPAQLVSIADTYDALVNDRVYKKAFPKDVAFNMIIVGDCGIFPPKILECFKDCRAGLEDWENGNIKFEQI